MVSKDAIDLILEQWSREAPHLDTSGLSTVGRVLILSRLLERRANRVFEPLGLALWSFDVLATLRRQGPPYRLKPTELSRATMLTSGAMTNRLDRLESKGWIRRERDPGDRRGVRVVLTKAGRKIVDQAVEVRMEEARDAAVSLGATDQRALETGLRRWLILLDGDD